MNELQFLIYSTPQEDIKVNVIIKDETLWLTQKAMSELFGVQVPAINKHLKIYFQRVNYLKTRLFPKWKQS
ncbi:MAG: hypothetical protein WCY89_10145 [Flavobacteriaceae bacterium]